MKLSGDKMNRINRIRSFGLISIIAISFFLIPLSSHLFDNNYKNPAMQSEFIHSSAENVYNNEWLNDNDFEPQGEWFYNKGAQGDNSTIDANVSGDSANYIVVGEESTFSLTAGDVNSSQWHGWDIYNNGDFLLPDTTEINSAGCYVYHYLDENEGGGAGQVHNFPSVHFRKNISLPNDMSDYEITSAMLEVIFNASVNTNVDAPGDIVGQSSIFDSATFYIEITDLGLSFPFRVAENKTSTLGQDSPPILNITDQELTYVSESDLITALNLALEKDPNHSDFTITMGIDIYCEDNDFPDYDMWNHLIFKSFNLTFDYQRKVDQFSSVSWNQIGNTISGSNIHISDANLNFRYKIDQDWPTSLSPFSEIRIIINNNQHPETVRLSSATTSLEDAKVGGFDVTNLILKDVNITVSLQVFIANTFSLDNNITISIDDVYLNITYVETFADYETESQLFLNKTTDPIIEVALGNTVNITIKYLENQTKNHISGANVQLSGKVSGELSPNGQQYSRDIDSTNLGIGIWLLTVTAEKPNYETQEIKLYVEVVERATEIELFVNSQNHTSESIQIEVNKLINLTVFYRDKMTKTHLIGADVTLLNIGNFSRIGLQYNYTVNSTDLGLGFNVLSIIAQLDNYSTQNIQVFVEVYDIATKLRLEVNEGLVNPLDTIIVEVNQLINLTVFYEINESDQHIPNATVSLGWDNFTETGSQYYYNLNTTTDLDQGITIITIEARFNDYQTQTIQIYFEVTERDTELEVHIDGSPKAEAVTISADVDQILNITVFYEDDLLMTHLPGANISIESTELSGNFNETGNQYSYSLNTNDLAEGVAILTIIAYLENYQPRSFQFYVEVSKRDTLISLYLDSVDKTNDSVYELPIGSSLNITVKYTDNQTEAHISGGLVDLEGDTYSNNLSENLNQYTLLLDTSNLEDGLNLFTITARANNYKVKALSLWLTINRITTIINTTSGESYFSRLPSESFVLSIVLIDDIFGGTITNANVTYRWAYGQGTLSDPEDDGIYEDELKDIPTGIYKITITASAGDDYNFETYEITLNVVSVTPPDFSMLFILLAGALVALVIGFTLYQVRFKYPATVRKSRKVRKKIKKGKKTKPIKDLTSREDLIKEHLDSNVETIQSEKKTENGIKEK